MWILDELKKISEKESIAIIQRDDRISFKQLWENSEKIADWINNNCVTKNPILIYGNKDVEIVEIMIGTLKTGRAYVPIDVTFPEERVHQIIRITEAEVLFNLGDIDIPVSEQRKCVDRTWIGSIIDNGSYQCTEESEWVHGDDNCYVLFTSGSTGEPKGVQISKNNIVNFVDWFAKHADVSGQVVLDQVSYSFDVSVIQLYLYLAMGKTLFCIDKGMIDEFGLLFEYLSKSGIASWVSTPAFIEMCAVYDAFDRKLLPDLEKITLAGEVLTKKLVRTLWEKFPGVKVINGYGPTEGTVLLTCCTITEEMVSDDDNGLPIGYMIDDARYSIDGLVEQCNAEDVDAKKDKGELVVCSASISRGYFKNKKATEKNFFCVQGDKHNSYRTGDVVYAENNLIYYCGRKDFQIKLNGYRIELDDISENINKIDGVNNNIVLPVYKDGRVSYIAAFIMLSRDFLGGGIASK